MTLFSKVKTLIHTPSDINEHLTTFISLCKDNEISTVTEFGSRALTSTYAWMLGLELSYTTNPKKLTCYDIYAPEYYGGSLTEIQQYTNLVNFEFKIQDVLKADIENTEVLFIDTWHTYDQLTSELKRHADKVSRFIVLHDTESFGYRDEPSTSPNTFGELRSGKVGLKSAVEDFLAVSNWEMYQYYINNNGLTILKRC